MSERNAKPTCTVVWVKVKPFGWVLVPPKCAATSFYFAVAEYQTGRTNFTNRNYALQTADEYKRVVQIPDATVIVRHPLDRFISAWRDKCRDTVRENHKNFRHWKTQCAGLTPHEFFEYAKEHKNQHWDFLSDRSPGGRYIKLESWPSIWEASTGIKYPRVNATRKEEPTSPFPDSLQWDILEYYAADLQTYLNAE